MEIHFFPGGTARYPNPHRVGRAATLRTVSGSLQGRQALEGFLIAEKAGDVDQQIAEQRADLLRIAAAACST